MVILKSIIKNDENMKIDRKLVSELELDPVFQKILQKVGYESDRYFRQAWVMHGSEKWYPVLIKDRETGVIGFEFNPGGQWGSKEKAGKSKLKLVELLSIIIRHSYHAQDKVRCDFGNGSTPSGRRIEKMQFDTELSALIHEFQSSTQLPNQTTKSELNKPVFSEEDNALAVRSAKAIEIFIHGFDGEERDAIAKYRVNQGKFRTLLLNYWGGACAVSGLSDERLLIASHILPWSKSTDNQKGDPFNGLLLSVVWDSLFDKGLISFDDEGKAILDRLTDEIIYCLGLKAEQPVIGQDKLTNEHKQYLQMHRILHQYSDSIDT